MKIKPAQISLDVAQALAEDIGEGDVSALLLSPEQIAIAEIFSREAMLVCGSAWVDEVFRQIDNSIKLVWLVKEGQWLAEPSRLCRIEGHAARILTAERTALNFLQTLSGTATKTYNYMQQIKGTQARLLDTRKTIPGLRLAQKYAVACAGGSNHRLGLYDAFLIKENHIKACGSISQAVVEAKRLRPDLLVEVEVENLAELQQALASQPQRILLDNFNLDELKQAVALTNHSCHLEASGGITMDNIRAVAQTGVDFISIGDLTKSVAAIDLSLLIKDIA